MCSIYFFYDGWSRGVPQLFKIWYLSLTIRHPCWWMPSAVCYLLSLMPNQNVRLHPYSDIPFFFNSEVRDKHILHPKEPLLSPQTAPRLICLPMCALNEFVISVSVGCPVCTHNLWGTVGYPDIEGGYHEWGWGWNALGIAEVLFAWEYWGSFCFHVSVRFWIIEMELDNNRSRDGAHELISVYSDQTAFIKL